jgi:hypothetical protein
LAKLLHLNTLSKTSDWHIYKMQMSVFFIFPILGKLQCTPRTIYFLSSTQHFIWTKFERFPILSPLVFCPALALVFPTFYYVPLVCFFFFQPLEMINPLVPLICKVRTKNGAIKGMRAPTWDDRWVWDLNFTKWPHLRSYLV